MKKLILLLLSLGSVFLWTLPVSAESVSPYGTRAEGETLPDAYFDMENILPDETKELLPDGLFSGNTEDAATAAEHLTDPAYLCEIFTKLAGVSLTEALSLLLVLCGILVLSAAANVIRRGLSGTTGDTFLFCTHVAIFAAIASTVAGTVETVRTYFTHLSEFCTALIPLLGTLYAIGGNVRAAVSSSAILEVYLSLVGSIAGSTVVPLFCACLVLLLIGAFGSVDTSAFSGFLRKTYMTLLSFFMMLLGILLAARTVLAARSDSVGMRGMRFAIGNIVPVVGGTVADMSGAVAASVEYLRGTVGVILLILLGFLLIPTIIRLFLTRAAFSLSSAVAGLIDCSAEGKLLAGIAELYGYLIGIACLCSSVAVVALSILVTCSAALGG